MSTAMLGGWRRLAVVGVAATVLGGAALVWGSAGAPRTALAGPVSAAAASCPVQADPPAIIRTTTAFALIDGVTGDSTDARHRGQVPLTGVQAGLLAGGSGLCGATGKAVFDPIVVDKAVDSASVPLMSKAATGARIKSVKITLISNGAAPIDFLTYELTDVRVISVRQVDRGNTLTEEVAFDFARITYTFVAQDAKGGLGAQFKFTFDVAANRAG